MLGLEDPGNHKLSRIAARNRIRSEFIPIDSDGVQLDRLAQSGVSLMHVSPANSFSKTLVPSLRISYMVLPPALIVRYLATMTFYSCTVSGSDSTCSPGSSKTVISSLPSGCARGCCGSRTASRPNLEAQRTPETRSN